MINGNGFFFLISHAIISKRIDQFLFWVASISNDLMNAVAIRRTQDRGCIELICVVVVVVIVMTF